MLITNDNGSSYLPFYYDVQPWILYALLKLLKDKNLQDAYKVSSVDNKDSNAVLLALRNSDNEEDLELFNLYTTYAQALRDVANAIALGAPMEMWMGAARELNKDSSYFASKTAAVKSKQAAMSDYANTMGAFIFTENPENVSISRYEAGYKPTKLPITEAIKNALLLAKNISGSKYDSDLSKTGFAGILQLSTLTGIDPEEFQKMMDRGDFNELLYNIAIAAGGDKILDESEFRRLMNIIYLAFVSNVNVKYRTTLRNTPKPSSKSSSKSKLQNQSYNSGLNPIKKEGGFIFPNQKTYNKFLGGGELVNQNLDSDFYGYNMLPLESDSYLEEPYYPSESESYSSIYESPKETVPLLNASNATAAKGNYRNGILFDGNEFPRIDDKIANTSFENPYERNLLFSNYFDEFFAKKNNIKDKQGNYSSARNTIIQNLKDEWGQLKSNADRLKINNKLQEMINDAEKDILNNDFSLQKTKYNNILEKIKGVLTDSSSNRDAKIGLSNSLTGLAESIIMYDKYLYGLNKFLTYYFGNSSIQSSRSPKFKYAKDLKDLDIDLNSNDLCEIELMYAGRKSYDLSNIDLKDDISFEFNKIINDVNKEVEIRNTENISTPDAFQYRINAGPYTDYNSLLYGHMLYSNRNTNTGKAINDFLQKNRNSSYHVYVNPEREWVVNGGISMYAKPGITDISEGYDPLETKSLWSDNLMSTYAWVPELKYMGTIVGANWPGKVPMKISIKSMMSKYTRYGNSVNRSLNIILEKDLDVFENGIIDKKGNILGPNEFSDKLFDFTIKELKKYNDRLEGRHDRKQRVKEALYGLVQSYLITMNRYYALNRHADIVMNAGSKGFNKKRFEEIVNSSKDDDLTKNIGGHSLMYTKQILFAPIKTTDRDNYVDPILNLSKTILQDIYDGEGLDQFRSGKYLVNMKGAEISSKLVNESESLIVMDNIDNLSKYFKDDCDKLDVKPNDFDMDSYSLMYSPELNKVIMKLFVPTKGKDRYSIEIAVPVKEFIFNCADEDKNSTSTELSKKQEEISNEINIWNQLGRRAFSMAKLYSDLLNRKNSKAIASFCNSSLEVMHKKWEDIVDSISDAIRNRTAISIENNSDLESDLKSNLNDKE